MGLLTDPSTGQGKLTKSLIKYYRQLCFLMYVGGLGYFLSLAHSSMNNSVYFSENALLPGLVKSEFRDDILAKLYLDELLDEMKKYDDSIPYPWLLAKFRQFGLDAYTHNFTLNYPLGTPKIYTGKNVYGILRAPRAASTEALILSIPYRPPVSVHQTTAPSIAIMLAFAKFASNERYWAKDIIFLITEHEQLGMQAWLEAYHGVDCGDGGTLMSGDLKGRAGAIQAAINLELHSPTIAHIDIKLEGLNGQLPNLDLFNLAARMCSKEGVMVTLKSRPTRHFPDPIKDWIYDLKTLLAMVATQATGIPNGNHGLYHRFGIEALTIEGSSKPLMRGATKVTFLNTGRIIEGIFRSLNNLLERFHQSYFFYLLPSSERFISIGLYIPAVCLIIGTLFIKACAKWCYLQGDETEDEDDKKKRPPPKKIECGVFIRYTPRWAEEFWQKYYEKYQAYLENGSVSEDSVNCVSLILALLIPHVLGILTMNSPQILARIGDQYNFSTDQSVSLGFVVISVLLLLLPIFVPFKSCRKSMIYFNILCLLELGTTLICLAMTNFSLALFCSVLYIPFALFIGVPDSWLHSISQKLFWFLVNPLIALIGIVFIYTTLMFPGEELGENFQRAIKATQQAIVFSIVDSMIYGNWLFSVVCAIFIPNWLCFWIMAFARGKQERKVSFEKKTN